MNPCDLNSDGDVNISDVSTLIDWLLSNNNSSHDCTTYDVTGFVALQDDLLQFYPVKIVRHRLKGDIDGDGKLSIIDVIELIDHILKD